LHKTNIAIMISNSKKAIS